MATGPINRLRQFGEYCSNKFQRKTPGAGQADSRANSARTNEESVNSQQAASVQAASSRPATHEEEVEAMRQLLAQDKVPRTLIRSFQKEVNRRKSIEEKLNDLQNTPRYGQEHDSIRSLVELNQTATALGSPPDSRASSLLDPARSARISQRMSALNQSFQDLKKPPKTP